MPLFEEQFKGKLVVVTGAGKGVGRALVIALHNIGAQVYAVTRSQADLDTLVQECPTVHPIQLDVSNWDDTKRILTEQLPQTVDVLINNAAVLNPELHLNITSDGFDRIMSTNVKAVINISQVVASKMIAAGTEGIILNVSSVGGIHPLTTCPVYCASKAALDALIRTMAIDYGKHKIRVLGFNPAGIQTNMSAGSLAPMYEGDVEKMAAAYLERIPLREFFIPMDQVVNTILFLSSGIAGMMTGSSVVLDGGYLTT